MAQGTGSDVDLATAGMMAEAKKRNAGGKKPPKVVKRIEHERGSDGTHVFTHHHTHPEHHPSETHHYKPNPEKPRAHDDQAVDHFIQHAVAPNEGEGEEMGEKPGMPEPAEGEAE